MTTTSALVEISNVTKHFGSDGRSITALEDVSALICERRVTGLVGPDGAGKTTLIRLIAGLLVPDAGNISVLGKPALDLGAKERLQLGYMPQGTGVYTDLSVAENLKLHADLRGLTRTQRRKRINELLKRTDLAEFRSRPAGKLSGGMAQKLGLACALVRPPRLLLLDEPSVGVDPLSRRELWQIVRSLAEDGIAVLWSTAYLDEAEKCDSVIVLAKGDLIFDGAPEDFTNQVQGRSFRLRAPNANLRALQRAALTKPRIVDAVLRATHLRLVTSESDDKSGVEESLEQKEIGKDATLERTEPSFEDALIAALKERRNGGQSQDPEAQEIASEGYEREEQDDGPAIRADDLTRCFGDFTAVDRVGFDVAYGEVFGLLGPNGAGKSTIFKMLCGLLPPSSGIVQIAGTDVSRSAASARGRIGYMSQRFALYAELSVWRNLWFFGAVYGLSRSERRRRIEEIMSKFHLADVADRRSGSLPLGFKQRLSLACAILHDPLILFLDEPTSGVDPLIRREFWLHINSMAERGVTVLVTTHFLEEAEYCDRLAIIDRGEIIALGSPQEIKGKHSNTSTEEATIEDAFVALLQQRREHEAKETV